MAISKIQKAKKISDPENPMEKLLQKHTKVQPRVFKNGTLVEGTVVSMAHNRLLLDIGGKSEGIVIGRELEDTGRTVKNLKVGDTVLAKVIQSENDSGYTVLSLRRAEKERHWRDFKEYETSETTLEAKVTEYNKGGLVVEVLGVQGFVPLSHLDRGAHFAEETSNTAAGNEADLAQKAESLVGQTLMVRVIEVNETNNRLVLSEKEVSSARSKQAAASRLLEIKAGEDLSGNVSGVTPFGVFVDLGGVEGLVHVSELAWDKVTMPSKLYKVGDAVTVRVLTVDATSGKLALSIKALASDPWDGVAERYPEGKIVQGIVSKIAPFGAFVNLEPGVDGLIHVSETVGPLKEGEDVEVVVVSVDANTRRLGLSVRRLQSLK